MLVLEPLWTEIIKRGMQTALVVDLFDEAQKVVDDAFERFIGPRIDLLAFRFRVVVGIASAAHRSDEAVGSQQIAIALGSVLRAADALLFVKRRFAWR